MNNSHTVLFELNRSKERLEYFQQMKRKNESALPPSVNKWIEIYSERVQNLEKQAKKIETKSVQ